MRSYLTEKIKSFNGKIQYFNLNSPEICVLSNATDCEKKKFPFMKTIHLTVPYVNEIPIFPKNTYLLVSHLVKKCQGTSRPCSYYDRGIKVRTRVGQNSLMFELLPVHGSFSRPTITPNILAYSKTSSLLTHLTTFNTMPFMVTYILSFIPFYFLFLLIPFLLYIHGCSLHTLIF